jgi:hypothetical protein
VTTASRFLDMLQAMLMGARLSWVTMSQREKAMADDAALLLRRRKLIKDYGVRWDEVDDIPADLVDALLLADEAEAAALESMRQQAAKR